MVFASASVGLRQSATGACGLAYRLGCCSPVGSVQHRPTRQRRPAPQLACHWHALAPRHAVLEWMWGRATRSGEGAVLPNSSSQPAKKRCWFDAMGIFWSRNGRKIPRKASTIIPSLAKKALPFLNDLFTASLDDLHNIPQGAFRNAGVVWENSKIRWAVDSITS